MTTTNRPLTEPQVRTILESKLSSAKLGSIMGISPSAVTRVRNGRSYQEVAPDLPRRGGPVYVTGGASCKRCIHWLESCSMGFPESRNSTTFAKTCSIYVIANPTDDDYR
jgi:hypothetical protein